MMSDTIVAHLLWPRDKCIHFKKNSKALMEFTADRVSKTTFNG